MLSEGRTWIGTLLPSCAFRQVIGDSRLPGMYCKNALRRQGSGLNANTRPPSACSVFTCLAIDSKASILVAVAI